MNSYAMLSSFVFVNKRFMAHFIIKFVDLN
jgi:hypothetical protein